MLAAAAAWATAAWPAAPQLATNNSIGSLLQQGGASDFSRVEILYVVPGGGPGSDGFPVWTRERSVAAVKDWRRESRCRPRRAPAPTCAFLALSCGSLNAPSARLPDGRVLFEAMATAQYLTEEGGVPTGIVITESFSWDTVTNALALRFAVEAFSALRAAPLDLRVFISHFHAERFEANARWALGVSPSLDGRASLAMHPVPSEAFGDPSALATRMEHEQRGAAVARENAKVVRTLAELHAFVLLGGHGGLWGYMHMRHSPSKGGGW
uniref:DUF218 domain-containing protein n=1 Tax=Coccolithus braarudii TaxID=221442 RepID=A0A7S0Q6T5_9EUKA|mmetsp:Transcript_43444/g.92466  ORF Transcript_43444/g.92466 Transcript_43444/m.92466 type:complete len:268 (+) Transcript_43444:15-818(+)|eukprot:CAMPEP_0183337672 /NCGR_PEP_ID=MMETSP0164_2-20130417/5226_1 /TAXON_ID=221442 /ORGANISM="Coccolithus pelagicus ssp braarudi, Strain PLY182g" /LENGTH=267 /DNA_ID=CAMNT_0025507395 /DNA_START=15 /DNA_END=818 /DNA_ORIENTATION=+